MTLSSPLEPRRRRQRAALVTALALVPAAAPALVEGAARRALSGSEGRCEGTGGVQRPAPCLAVGRVDLDLRGLHLHEVAGRVQGRALDAARVDLSLGDAGLDLRIHGLQGQIELGPRAADPREVPRSAAPDPGPSRTLPTWAEGWKTRARELVDRLPMSVEAEGFVELRHGDRTLRVEAPRLRRDAAGGMVGSFDLVALRGDQTLATGRALELTAPPPAPGGALGSVGLSVQGVVALPGGDELGLRGRLDRELLELQFATHGGGQAWLKVPHPARPDALDLRLEALDLGALDPLRAHLEPHVHLDLAHTTASGGLRLRTEDDPEGGPRSRVRVDFDHFELRGLALESDLLAREPLLLRDILLAGHLEGSAAPGARAVRGALQVAHGEARGTLRGEVDGEGVSVDARLDPLPCQALLGAMPQGLLPMLEGARLEGRMGAKIALDVRWADLRATAEAEAATGEAQPAPGHLEVDFPFLEACEITRDAPGIDIAALAGPYRHRFLSDGGHEHVRVFDPGDPEWVRLEDVPRLARAFIVLEDVGFWSHDGFDREQIARAFWHDLTASRFSRGASTITQQTARNLWLGIDRSVGRKLQEAVYAARMEEILDKRRILEIYLNVIELGPEVHGVREAAAFHFGRRPEELSLLQAVHLASLAPGPVLYSRRFEGGEIDDAWRTHLREQIRRLRIHGLTSHEAASAALRSELGLLDRRQTARDTRSASGADRPG